MKQRKVAIRWFASMVACSACSVGDRVDQALLTRTDSAGVEVVVTTARSATLRPVFTVSADPQHRIGVEDGPEELQFSRVASVVRLPDQRIAVANGQPLEIRIFDPQGAFVARHGHFGQGPGEFRFVGRLLTGGGDTLLAVNERFQLQRFDAARGYLGTTTVSRDSLVRHLGGMRLAEGVAEYFRDGSVVVAARAEDDAAFNGDEARTGELFRPTTTLVWIAGDYARSHVIGEFGEIQQHFLDVGGGRREPVIPPSARRRVSALNGRGTRFCVADSDVAEVRCVDHDGDRLIVRWNQDTVPTTKADMEAWRQNQRASAARPGAHLTPQAVERIIASVVVPPTRPSVSSVIVAEDGAILVAGPDLTPSRNGWRRYRVFSARGELLGIADLPPVQVHHLGPDYLLAVWRNDDGVEFVVWHTVAEAGRK